MRYILLLGLVVLSCLAGCGKSSPPPILNSPESLRAYFRTVEPKISAHRGGAAQGYPENCLETFQYTAGLIPTIIECDVTLTRDSVMVLLHDRTLERTTTGTGKVADYTWLELQELFLVDTAGQQTTFRIPTLESVLVWSKDRVPLTLDVRREVPPVFVVNMLHRLKIHNAAIITYSSDEAAVYAALDSSLILSCSIRSIEDYERLRLAGVREENILAFVGVSEPEEKLYRFLAERNIPRILGVLGNLDRRAAVRGDHLYREWIENGATILATDRPLEAYAALFNGRIFKP